MRDCEWLTSQVTLARARRRYEKRRALRARFTSLVHFGHQAAPLAVRPSRPGDADRTVRSGT